MKIQEGLPDLKLEEHIEAADKPNLDRAKKASTEPAKANTPHAQTATETGGEAKRKQKQKQETLAAPAAENTRSALNL